MFRLPEKVTNKEVFERIGEKRTLLNSILPRKTKLIERILRRNCHRDVTERQMTQVKAVGRRTQLLDDLGEKKRKVLGNIGGC